VLERYNSVNALAQKVANRPFRPYSSNEEDFVAPVNEQQLAGINTINQGVGLAQPYFDMSADYTARGAQAPISPGELNIDQFMSPYTDKVVDATSALIDQTNEQQMAGQTSNAISQGAFGSDRSGIAAAVLAGQQSMARNKTLADILQQGYSQALSTAQQQQGVDLASRQADAARMMAAGQQYAGLGQAAQGAALAGGEAQINAGTLQQQTSQAGKTALYNQFLQRMGYPFQVAQFLANIAMGTGSLSGSTTTTTQPAPFFSDRRLKTDITRVGKTDNGMPIYRFRYKGDDKNQFHIGFMAQDVEKEHPDAVGESNGYKTVDYSKASKFAEGGAVDAPYGSKVGAQPGLGSYVPAAYLPVGDLMTADPGILANDQKSMADYMNDAANFGDKIVSLRETYGKMKDWYDGKAEGGAVSYLDDKKDEADQPVPTDSYVGPTVAQQEKDTQIRDMMKPDKPNTPPSPASQIGGMAGGLGSLASGIAALIALSDRRAKENIKRIGWSDHNLPIYQFRYKGDPSDSIHIGFIAQDVEKRHPDAVHEIGGLKHIDLSKAHKFARGGLAEGGIPEEEEDKGGLSGVLNKVYDWAMTPATSRANPNPAENQNTTSFSDVATSVGNWLTKPSGVGPAIANATEALPSRTPATTPGLAATTTPNAVRTERQPGLVPAQPVATNDNAATTAVVPGLDAPRTIEAAPKVAAVPADTTPTPTETGYQNMEVAWNKPQTVESYIRAAAEARGIDPDIAVAVAKREGLAEGVWQSNVRKGDMREPSYGPYQLLVGDGVNFPKGMGNDFMRDTGLDPRDPTTVKAQIDYVMDKIGETGWSPFYGAKAAGIDRWDGITNRSKEPGLAAAVRKTADTAVDSVQTAATGIRDTVSDIGREAGQFAKDTGRGLKDFLSRNAGNQDLILSILSGLGTMASSPSRYLGSAILQGIGGAANTYSALQNQNAEIRESDANAARTSVNAMRESIYFDPSGTFAAAILADGSMMNLADYLTMPSPPKLAGGELSDSMRRQLNEAYQQRGKDGVMDMLQKSTTLTPEGTQTNEEGKPILAAQPSIDPNNMWSPELGKYVSMDENLLRSTGFGMPSAERKKITEQTLLNNSAAAQDAVENRPSTTETGVVVAEAIASGNMGTVGPQYAEYVIKPFKTFMRSIGVSQETIDGFGESADAQQDLLNKHSIYNAQNKADVNGQRALGAVQQFMELSPQLSQSPEAASMIMAQQNIQNQMAIDKANFDRVYLQQSKPGRGYLGDGSQQAWAERSSALYNREQGELSQFYLASQRLEGDAKKSVAKFLKGVRSGVISDPEVIQTGIQRIMQQAYGPDVQVSPILYRYFMGAQ